MFAKDALSYAAIPLPDRFAYSDTEMRARAQAFHDHMRRRHTVRDFSDRPVPREVIETCIRTAGTAPPSNCSTYSMQPPPSKLFTLAPLAPNPAV